jgi:hypothetical protein
MRLQKRRESPAAPLGSQTHFTRTEFFMRNLIAVVLLVLLLCVVGFGFYRGWFSLSHSNPDMGSNKVNISLTVDPDKMKADTAMMKEKTIEPTAQVTAGAK